MSKGGGPLKRFLYEDGAESDWSTVLGVKREEPSPGEIVNGDATTHPLDVSFVTGLEVPTTLDFRHQVEEGLYKVWFSQLADHVTLVSQPPNGSGFRCNRQR